MFPEMLEFMCLLRILAPVLDDIAYSRDDSFTPEREEGLYQLYHLSFADWQRGDVSTRKPRASRLSQQLWNKQKRSETERWFTGRENKRELERWCQARLTTKFSFVSAQNVQTGFCISFVCKLIMSFAICKGGSGREQFSFQGFANPPLQKGLMIKPTASSPRLKKRKTQTQHPWGLHKVT